MRIVCALVVGFVAFAAACSGPRTKDAPPTTERLIEGDRALREGRLADAAEIFDAATKAPEESFYGWVGLAMIADARGLADAFDSAATVAMALDPGAPETQDLLGRMLLSASTRRNPRDRRLAATAFGYFRRVAERAPDLPHLRYHAGLAALTLGDALFAEAAFEAAITADPDSEQPKRALAALRSGAAAPPTLGPPSLGPPSLGPPSKATAESRPARADAP